MNKKLISKLMMAGAIAFGVISCEQGGNNEPAKLNAFQDSLSYSYGILIANQLTNIEGLDAEMVAAGVREQLNKNGQLTPQQANDVLSYEMRKEGEDFLAENAKKEGVIVTESGLQYKILEEGSGRIPTATNTVKVHYTGTLVDGTKFDSSVDRGEPAEFPLNRVVAGWTEGFQLLKEGTKAILYIPYDLGYGPRGSQGVIPPYATLIFEVELIEIVD
nr:FKBP-type peptidyl-prolyl cis-trans isomerase [uncultured Carboxylicivirga sp.]